MSAAINIMMGLIIHKGPESISLGIALSKNFKNEEQKRNAIRLIIMFSLATPIGIGIGMILANTNVIIEILFMSFAGGTFVYIAASEVIVEEFSIPGHNKWLKMLSFVVGAAIITCMWLLESDWLKKVKKYHILLFHYLKFN